MQSKLEKKIELYYKDLEGIIMTYSAGLSQQDLTELQLVTDSNNNNNFNVFIGFKNKN
jgi:hypothetical protein